MLCLGIFYEPAHDKIYNNTYATSEDSDQPVHPRSLISLHRSHVPHTASGLSKEGLTRTMPKWVDVEADLSLCWLHRSYCGFCRALAHIVSNDTIS